MSTFNETLDPIGNKTEDSIEKILAEVDALIGQTEVKEEIKNFVLIAKVCQKRKEFGLQTEEIPLRLAFIGKPGTGKLTVAKYMARLYKCLGLLPTDQLIEVEFHDFISGYIGQTAIKTYNLLNKSMGATLFIHDAFNLDRDNNQDPFGCEAIDTLLQVMENYRRDFAIIIAGAPDLMHPFMVSHPGINVHFTKHLNFKTYSSDELFEIFKLFCQRLHYVLTDAAETAIKNCFVTTPKASIYNGISVQNLFSAVITKQTARIAAISESKIEDLTTIIEDDVINALSKY
jgi:AAA+ superfamily predicted ATPase